MIDRNSINISNKFLMQQKLHVNLYTGKCTYNTFKFSNRWIDSGCE